VIPTLVIVGRPNVGKSTLFNRLTRSRDAIVADIPGLTRDRHYGRGRVGYKSYIVVDTGGLEPVSHEGVMQVMAQQTLLAIDEADAVVLLVDGRQGLTAQDRAIAEQLRRTGRKIWLVVNKAEGMQPATVNAEFHELALGEPLAISAAHGEGVGDLAELITADFPERVEVDEDAAPETRPRIAIVGRPNVGKSTLVNSMLGEERVVVFDQPGTTRDSIYVDFERAGKLYTLIDTAGLRRKAKVGEMVEKFSVVKTLQSIEDANVVVLVVDAQLEITDQDAHIAGFVLEAGRALVLAVNKWDGLDESRRDQCKRELARKLSFAGFARVHYVSALEGRGLSELIKSIDLAYSAAMAKLSTPKLTRALIAAVAKQPPPRHGLFRPKLRYAHQGGVNPPVIVVHGNQLDTLPDSYKRYLERYFIDLFRLQGTPVRIQFKMNANPYSERR